MKYRLYIVFSLHFLLGSPSFGQNHIPLDTSYAVVDTLKEVSGLFDSNELINISLRFNITRYKNKRDDKEYLDAILTYYKSDGDSVNKNIKVRSRGVFRREYCELPPLLLNFKMKDSISGEFSNINKLKMVTQCKTSSEDLLLKEYLIYKLYNVLTDNSYKVRLMRVNYINTERQKESVSQYAFVIEPLNSLLKRTKCVEIITNLTQKNVKPEYMNRMAMFNYMIGNTDWSVPIKHNVELLAQPFSERPDLAIAIPYDFDFSGLVDASYAAPFEGLKIKSVLSRQYLGICRSEEEYIKALVEFADKKAEFYKIINEFPYLNARYKKEMISYLESFYKDINSKNSLARSLKYDCISF